ncbi:hypothetical protein TeGR_g7727 [Tetraparma gracilis]|uniref:Uncharacterized protein n=1 Tax=Tetraparma gracilis TaxID=2962635 RepID=A0ABQ6MM14_9STRA|nr:hypothetical protein TeGR_g7727 [Tetraparma gracilis]
MAPLSLGVWFMVAFKASDVEREVKAILGCLPLLLWTMWYSSAGGWLFWLGEAVGTTFVILFALPEALQTPNGFLMMYAGGLFVGWFVRGRFWSYFFIEVLVAFLFLLSVLVFPLCEMLIKDDTDALLKIYSAKIKEAVAAEVSERLKRSREEGRAS